PIPNTEVKLSSADGSWDLVPVRVGRRQASLRRVRMTRLFCVYFYLPNVIIHKFNNAKNEKRMK
ncbi:hypothetical protein, partial [Bacillus sp. FDAARGOS_235]